MLHKIIIHIITNLQMFVSYSYTFPNPAEVGGMPMKLLASKPEFTGGSTFVVVVGWGTDTKASALIGSDPNKSISKLLTTGEGFAGGEESEKQYR
jgi:hypothetical protein